MPLTCCGEDPKAARYFQTSGIPHQVVVHTDFSPCPWCAEKNTGWAEQELLRREPARQEDGICRQGQYPRRRYAEIRTIILPDEGHESHNPAAGPQRLNKRKGMVSPRTMPKRRRIADFKAANSTPDPMILPNSCVEYYRGRRVVAGPRRSRLPAESSRHGLGERIALLHAEDSQGWNQDEKQEAYSSQADHRPHQMDPLHERRHNFCPQCGWILRAFVSPEQD